MKFSFVSWEKFYTSMVVCPMRVSVVPVRWLAPREGYKLNSDGCSRGNPDLGGGEGLLCDCQGNVIFGYLCSFGSLTSFHTEFKVLRFGVQ